MDHIPTEVDLATKADITTLGDRLNALGDRLNALGDRLDARIDGIDSRLEHVESRLDRLEAYMVRFDDKLDGFHQALREQTRTYMLTMTGVMASFAAVIVATGILT